MRALIFTSEALDDLREASRWYEEQREGLGAAFQLAVEAVLTRAQRMPAAFPVIDSPFHRAVVKRFPYDVYYTFDERVVPVHTARDPARIAQRLRRH